MLNFRKIRRSLQRRDRPQNITPRPSRRRRPQGVDPAGRDLDPGERLTAITPAGVSGRALGPICPAPLLRPSESTRDKFPKMPSSISFSRPARRHRRALVQTGPSDQRVRFRVLTRKICLPRRAFATTPRKPPRSRTRSSQPMTRHALRCHRPRLCRKGHAGEDGADPGEVGWSLLSTTRPPDARSAGRSQRATYLIDAPIAGDPHYHPHNFLPNWLSPKMAGSARSTPALSPPIASTNTAPISRPNLPTVSALWRADRL